MKKEQLIKEWYYEEEIAHIHGWDFSHINDRYKEEEDLPWDYEKVINEYRVHDHKLLDIDTGGGEFLLTLKHPFLNTSATEGYEPNVALCKEVLLPLGIDFKESDGIMLPFEDKSFDLIINRHGEYDINELYRVLKPGGLFITQQVGRDNDKELIKLLLPDALYTPLGSTLKDQVSMFNKVGFSIIKQQEAYRPIHFYNVGALVWFAHIIEWEFPNFNVRDCIDQLFKAQEILEMNDSIDGTIHRFLIVAQK